MRRQALVLALLAAAFAAVSLGAEAPELCWEECSCDRERMVCRAAGLQSPPKGAWPNVTSLLLHGNHLPVLANNSFVGFPALQDLLLAHNDISAIDAAAFEDLSQVFSIDLEDNSITTIRFLRVPKTLYNLQLSGNPLNFEDVWPLPEDAPFLKNLNMDDVGLVEFVAEGFTGFSQLSLLSARYNDLKVLDLNVFVEVKTLVYLNVDYNNIDSVLRVRSPVELNMMYIDLSNNKLSSLDPDVFQELPVLALLKLTANPLIILGNAPLLRHSNLRSLYLSSVDAKNISIHTMKEIPSLEELDLQKCGLVNITGLFLNLTSLNVLYLQNNSIDSVEVGTFPMNGEMELLLLSDNPLRKFDVSALQQLQRVAEVHVSDTLLSCSCGYEDLLQWARHQDIVLQASCFQMPPCQFPPL